MMPHGFTREHNEPRSHAFALYDQIVVDRAFGGRFRAKDGWEFLTQPGGNFKVWTSSPTLPRPGPQGVQAGHGRGGQPGVHVTCKSADHILDWAYMGDRCPAPSGPAPRRWWISSRT